jgi:hypothetical protein
LVSAHAVGKWGAPLLVSARSVGKWGVPLLKRGAALFAGNRGFWPENGSAGVSPRFIH